jgi:hypothetical protein
MVRYLGRGMRALVCAVAVIGVLAGPAAAKQPLASGDPTASGGTGVAVWPGVAPTVATGIPAGYAELKASQVAALAAGKAPGHSVERGNKKGTGQASAIVNATLGSTCYGNYPCAYSIVGWFPAYHQMQPYYCVVAFVQSVAAWDISPYYQTMGTGSQLGAQNLIYSQMNGGRFGPGVYDPYALSWINARFSAAHYSFFYVPVWPTSTSAFMSYVRLDLATFVESNYVRVNLAYGQYGGYGSGGLHATGTLAYNDSAGTITSYDPFASRNSDGSCGSTYYSYSQTKGCYWTMSQSRYYLAMDKGSGDGTSPVWY